MNTTVFRRRGPAYLPKGFVKAPLHEEAQEKFYRRIVGFAAGALQLQGIKVYIEGAEKIPADGPALLALNHTGYYDFILGGVPAKMHNERLVRYMAKKEIFDTPVVGWLMRNMHHISVDRSAGSHSLNEAVEVLQAGNLVGIFPEATISRSFEIKDLKTGAARIAHRADAPLIPLIIWGSQRIWTKDLPKNLGRSNTPIWIRVGDPIAVTGDPDVDTATLKSAMEAILKPLQQDYAEKFGPFPPGTPWLPEAMGGGAPTLERAELLAMEERERRQTAKERKQAQKLRKLERNAERKSANVLNRRGIFGRAKSRVTDFIAARREH